jgi:hypothetical protein
MSEILTESFCERCGTRYTFESARPKIRLKGVKVLSRGLKNFVLSDDTTIDEAMAAARSETDREATAHQLDAFHKTFNFCMSCRQYTCPNCWNEVEARCQSCAPLPEPELVAPEVVAPAFPGLVTLAGPAAVAEPDSNGSNGHEFDVESAPPAAAAEAWSPDATTAPASSEEPPAAETAAEEAPSAPPEPPAVKASGQTATLLQRFRPGQSLDAELAAYERERAGAEPVEVIAEAPVEAPAEVAAEPAAREEVAEVVAETALAPTAEAAATTSAPAAEPEPEIALVPEPEPEPVAAEAPVAEEPVETAPAVPPAADVVEQPTWRITAPDLEPPAVGASLPPSGQVPPAVEPQWPARPEWPTPQSSAGLPFLGRPAQPQGGADALWAASNRELVTTPPPAGRTSSGIQPCVSCGLSLSANARFCRRCGTLQGS